MKNEKGQEVTQRECKGKHIDDDCKARNCKNAEHGCIIQELKAK